MPRALFIALLPVLVAVSHARTISLSPSCAPDCTPAIQNALNSCSSSSDACTIVFAPGIYPAHADAYHTLVTVQNAKNLALTGYGATILLTELTGGFVFSNVSGLTISGLTFEMERLPYTFGIVTDVSGSSITLAVNLTAYPFPASYPWLEKVGN